MRITVSVTKADIGSIGGRTCPWVHLPGAGHDLSKNVVSGTRAGGQRNRGDRDRPRPTRNGKKTPPAGGVCVQATEVT